MTSIGGGNILNVASTAGISPRPNLSWYNATKGWMISATKAMAIELASKKIRVNAIAPSLVNTPLASKFLNNESKIEKANERHPLGRIGNAKEIAQAAGFLLGPESSWMTGRVLQLDGGIGNLKT